MRDVGRPAYRLFQLLLILSCASLLVEVVQGAGWVRTYGPQSSIANSLEPTADGGYILAGSMDRAVTAEIDAWVMKLDSAGNVVWRRTFDSGNLDHFAVVRPTAEGDYLVAGLTPSPRAGESDALILKLDTSGNLIWQKAYGGMRGGNAADLRPTPDGGSIVAGLTYEERLDAAFGVGWVLKLDPSGDIVWQKTYAGTVPAGRGFRVIQMTANGGYIAAGAMSSPGVWVVQLDAAGNIVWQKTYAAPGDEVTVNDLRATADGGYVVVGTNFPDGFDWSEGWVLKLDRTGNIAWQNTVGRRNATSNLAFLSVQPTPDGGYLVVGETSIPYRNDASLWRFDNNGNVLWQRNYGGSAGDGFRSIHTTADGGIVILGRTDSFGSGGVNTWVFKLDASEGMLGCVNEATATPTLVDREAIAVNGTATTGSISVRRRSTSIALADSTPVVWQQCPIPLPSSQVVAIEYYHPDFDHYFVTALKSEIDALDRGVFAGWHRTLSRFRALGLDANEARVCRFWSGQTFAPKSSHFHSSFASECAAVSQNRDWQYEGEVFAVKLPDADGTCAPETSPLYRLYNNGMGDAPNHRYITSPYVRSNMIAQGWVPEGSGIGVIGCVTPE